MWRSSSFLYFLFFVYGTHLKYRTGREDEENDGGDVENGIVGSTSQNIRLWLHVFVVCDAWGTNMNEFGCLDIPIGKYAPFLNITSNLWCFPQNVNSVWVLIRTVCQITASLISYYLRYMLMSASLISSVNPGFIYIKCSIKKSEMFSTIAFAKKCTPFVFISTK